MKFNLIPASNIERSKLDSQIIRETAAQVIKDFANFGMDITFPENPEFAYDSLFSQLKIIIEDLTQSNPEKLSSLLYHIDLDERKINSPEQDAFNPHERISEMILEREFLKVLTRHYFRNQTSEN